MHFPNSGYSSMTSCYPAKTGSADFSGLRLVVLAGRRFVDFAQVETCGPASSVNKPICSVANRHSTKFGHLSVVGLPHCSRFENRVQVLFHLWFDCTFSRGL